MREIERIVCMSEPSGEAGHTGGLFGANKNQLGEEAAKLRKEFDAAIRAGTLGEREQMLAAIQQPKLIAERTEVSISIITICKEGYGYGYPYPSQ